MTARARRLQAKGITVLRFWNNDVLGNMEGVWTEISRATEALKSGRATPSLTLPLLGGGDEQEPQAKGLWLGGGR